MFIMAMEYSICFMMIHEFCISVFIGLTKAHSFLANMTLITLLLAMAQEKDSISTFHGMGQVWGILNILWHFSPSFCQWRTNLIRIWYLFPLDLTQLEETRLDVAKFHQNFMDL